jgi:hypothetical protein
LRLVAAELAGRNFNDADAVGFFSDVGYILLQCLRKS